MTDKPWKATERAIAARLGGRRVPITGRSRGDVPDVRCDWLAVEVKLRRHLPGWLKTAMQQAVAAAGVSQLPIVVLHESGQRHGRDIVCMSLADFESWFGEVSADVTLAEGEG